jgi:hypothetical protein
MNCRLFLLVLIPGIALVWPCHGLEQNGKAPEPTLVTLQGDKVSLIKALDHLNRLTGIQFDPSRGVAEVELPLELKDVPFWQALDIIAAKAKMRIQVSSLEKRITLVKQEEGAAPRISYSGPFRTSLKRIQASRDLDTGHQSCLASLEVAWEPQLLPLYLETRPQDLRVTDSKNNSLPVKSEGKALAHVDGRYALSFNFHLPPVPRAMPGYGSIQGHLTAIVPTKMVLFTFDTLDKLEKAPAGGPERVKKQEGVTCNISKIVLANDRWTIQVSLENQGGGTQLDSYQSWIVNNKMVLESSDGKKVEPSDYTRDDALGSSHRAKVSYTFRDQGLLARGKPGDWTLSYTTPASVITVPIPFSFKDITLP